MDMYQCAQADAQLLGADAVEDAVDFLGTQHFVYPFIVDLHNSN
jgi:hypothetical protein